MPERSAIDVAAAVTPSGVVSPARLLIEGDRILACDRPERVPVPAGATTIERPGATLVPGFIDLQVNGAMGGDFGGPDAGAAWDGAQAWFARSGVTTACPTVTTRSPSAMLAAVRALAAVPAGATHLAGIHLEGPYLAPTKAGAHDPAQLREPDLVEAAALLEAGPVVIWTLAPERPGALDLIRLLADRGVLVSIGHSDATSAIVADAVTAGARLVTHLFNAQRLITPREPGIPGAFLATPALTAGMILDGVHVAPELVGAIFAAAPDRVIGVSDAAPFAGLAPGIYEVADRTIVLSEDAPRLLDGTLAGSSVGMDRVFATALAASDLPTAVAACATRPAQLLGRGDLGRLAPDALADLVIWAEGRVVETWRGGVRVPHAEV